MRILILAAVALAAAQPSLAADPVAPVTVSLANFSFTPKDLHLKSGQRVTIHFVNTGSGGHDFTAPEFFTAATMDAANRAKVGKKGRVSLGKGESADVTLVPHAGHYDTHCSHLFHAGFGMTGHVVVD